MNFKEKERMVREMNRPKGESEIIKHYTQEYQLEDQRLQAAREQRDWKAAAERAAACKMLCDKLANTCTYVAERNWWQRQASGYREMELQLREQAGEKIGFFRKLLG